MIRRYFLAIAFALLPIQATAMNAPPGQTVIDAHNVLRGVFVEEHSMGSAKGPAHTSGHFVVAPAHGLIWNIEQPFPTETVITPNGLVQHIGGLALRLPAKNLRHLYDMVGGALAGNWNELEADFVITPSGSANHWQMLLTPRANETSRLPYSIIAVSGSRFVEKIMLTKNDGGYDEFRFSDESLSSAPPAAQELMAFKDVAH